MRAEETVMLSAAILTTPLGSLQLIARDGLLERIAFPGTHVERLPAGDTPVLRRAVAQYKGKNWKKIGARPPHAPRHPMRFERPRTRLKNFE